MLERRRLDLGMGRHTPRHRELPAAPLGQGQTPDGVRGCLGAIVVLNADGNGGTVT